MSPCHLQLVNETDKSENVSTNEVDPDFKEGINITKTKEKIEQVGTKT